MTISGARPAALFDEIVRIVETLGVPAVPYELVVEQAVSLDPFVRCIAWTQLATERAVDALARARRVAIEWLDGELMIRPLVPLRPRINFPNVTFSLAAYHPNNVRSSTTTRGLARTTRARWMRR